MAYPLVCVMPLNHPLAAKNVIKPKDLNQIPFVNFDSDTYIGSRVKAMFETYGVKPQTTLVSNGALTLCELVAAGLGASLVHPLMLSGLEQRLTVRRFEPDIMYNFQLCRSADSRNATLIEAFAQALRATAAQISRTMLDASKSGKRRK